MRYKLSDLVYHPDGVSIGDHFLPAETEDEREDAAVFLLDLYFRGNPPEIEKAEEAVCYILQLHGLPYKQPFWKSPDGELEIKVNGELVDLMIKGSTFVFPYYSVHNETERRALSSTSKLTRKFEAAFEGGRKPFRYRYNEKGEPRLCRLNPAVLKR